MFSGRNAECAQFVQFSVARAERKRRRNFEFEKADAEFSSFRLRQIFGRSSRLAWTRDAHTRATTASGVVFVDDVPAGGELENRQVLLHDGAAHVIEIFRLRARF